MPAQWRTVFQHASTPITYPQSSKRQKISPPPIPEHQQSVLLRRQQELTNLPESVTNMLNKLHGQPESYEKKFAFLKTISSVTEAEHNDRRSRYKFGKTLGAGTYGIVREADGPTGKVAIKIILKKNVKGNEQMVYDELEMLQRLHHPHIVQFHDWFESRVGASTVPKCEYG